MQKVAAEGKALMPDNAKTHFDLKNRPGFIACAVTLRTKIPLTRLCLGGKHP
jgi:hypothetical protein